MTIIIARTRKPVATKIALAVAVVVTAALVRLVILVRVLLPLLFAVGLVELLPLLEEDGFVLPPITGSGLLASTSHVSGVALGQAGALRLGLYAAALTPEGTADCHWDLRLLKSGTTGVGVPERGHPSGGAPGEEGSTWGPYVTSP
jgi:hypothetical protein